MTREDRRKLRAILTYIENCEPIVPSVRYEVALRDEGRKSIGKEIAAMLIRVIQEDLDRKEGDQ